MDTGAALTGLVRELAAAGRFDEANDAAERALREAPRDLGLRTEIGRLMRAQGELEAAIGHFEAVLHAAPEAPEARINLAATLDEAGDVERALALIDSALPFLESSPAARWLVAPVLLRAGRFAQGFACFEARWQAALPGLAMRPHACPLWQPAATPGSRLLLWHEQGLGDSILSFRLALAAAQRDVQVTVHAQPALTTLFAARRGIDVVGSDAGLTFDAQLPLMSLFHVLGVTPEGPASAIPYLEAPADRRAKWAALLPPTRRPRVGVAWHSTIYRDDPLVTRAKLAKSLPLTSLAPLAAVRGVDLVSLQVGPGADETQGCGFTLLDLTAHIDDLADTAALVERLDAVVSIDTSVAHLAGALGKPLLVLSAAHADWRWHAGSQASPWYPQARVLRQTVRGDWRAPVAAAAAALRALVPQRTLLGRWLG